MDPVPTANSDPDPSLDAIEWRGGGVHAFILDTMVTASLRRSGLAKTLVAEAVDRARQSGCEWLHVDFDPHLRAFYFDACGFEPLEAGLIPLK